MVRVSAAGHAAQNAVRQSRRASQKDDAAAAATALSTGLETAQIRNSGRGPGRVRATWREKKLEEEKEDNQRLLAGDSRLQDAQHSTCMQMLKACEFGALTLGDVQHLFKILGGSSEYIEYEQLRMLLTAVLDPPFTNEEVQALWNLSEKRPDGNLSAEEIYTAMTSGNIMLKLDDIQKGKHKKWRSEETGPVVDRELFKTWVAWRQNRDDAFQTLPIAVTYLLVFVFLVMNHLQIAGRKLQERALETWVDGWSMDWGGPYLGDHVTSVGYFYAWLKDSGMPCLFSDARPNSAGDYFIHMASSSLIVGDAKLVRIPDGNPGFEEAWILNSQTAKASLQDHLAKGDSNPYQLAAVERLEWLNANGFFHYEVEEMRLEWMTYNRRTRMFCQNVIRVAFQSSGYIVPSMSATAVIIEPYPRSQIVKCIFIWSLCGLFCVLILIPLWQEGQELLLSMKVGLKGFISYWGFWNAVDWSTVVVGITLIALWISCCQCMQADGIQALIDDDFNLNPAVMGMNVVQLRQVQDDLSTVVNLFFTLQCFMAINVITMLMKLFKAFQSNARLNVVTDTMIVAAADIVHFLIVFLVIFLGFAMMAHVLFGNDMLEFESVSTSMMTSWLCLMGDFGWYVDFQNSPTGFGSGMPRAAMTIWYLSFQIFVLLCLLNMLLAIIMERYTQVTSALEGSAEAPTLWVQVGRYFERRKATKGFIPLVSIMTALELEGSQQVHASNTVTTDSIVQAFPGMKPEQGKWLMKYLDKEAKARAPSSDSFEDAGEKLGDIQVFVESIAQELHIVQICALLASRRLDALESQAQSSNDQSGEEKLAAKAESIINAFGQQMQEQARATEELRAMMQELESVNQKLSMTRSRVSATPMSEEKLKVPSSGPKTLPPCCGIQPAGQWGNQGVAMPPRQPPPGWGQQNMGRSPAATDMTY